MGFLFKLSENLPEVSRDDRVQGGTMSKSETGNVLSRRLFIGASTALGVAGLQRSADETLSQ